jgi:hypothetical protein
MQSAVADVIGIGGLELRFLVDETQGSGDLVIFEMTIQPNARVPIPHYHREVRRGHLRPVGNIDGADQRRNA